MKNSMYVAFSLLLLIALVTPACDWWAGKKKAETPAEVKQDMAQEPKLRLVDVNTDEVFKDAHIPGAIHASANKIEEVAKGWGEAAKGTPTVFYCSGPDCDASRNAAKKAIALGFKEVWVFEGGISKWNQMSKENKALYPVEGEAKAEFLAKPLAPAPAPKEGDVRTISAEDLAKRVEEAKVPKG